ncbi:MAG TPA: PQQ-dependent sugar dehydrogenase, partial [Marmoricola sp.]|nr:PQQ-dependent sugar dehydrogenase [Marmoricola sp.]
VAACGEDTTKPETAKSPTTAASSAPAPTGVTMIARKLQAPWSITFHRDVPLVSERDSARILELAADGQPREVARIDGVQGDGEGGLLGITAHEGYLYVYSTAGSENRIQRYRITGEPGGLGLQDPETLVSGIPAASNHNGGRLAFGPDGMLYATTGDSGEQDLAQDRDSLAGKILRMTPEGKAPADNPFPGSLVYSYGHRNPQGIAWASDGTMYAAEFGQDTWDELNIIKPGSNYGWPIVEGIGGDQRYADPIREWAPAEASPSGIAILGGNVYVANLRGERLRQVSIADPSQETQHWEGRYGRLRDVVVAPDGSLWVLTNNTDGRGDPGPVDDRILRFAPGG